MIMQTQRSLRVLMVDSERSWRGGQAQVDLLMRGLVELGHDISIAAPGDSVLAKRASANGITHHVVDIRGGFDLSSSRELRRVVKTGNFDVVHTHSSHAHSTMWLACIGLQETPLRVVSRRVDFPVAKGWIGKRKYHSGVDVYLAISLGVNHVLEAGGVDPAQIRIVPSGIDLDKFTGIGDGALIRDEFGIAENATVVGNIAALAPHKSQIDFVLAAKQISEQDENAVFLIVGEGSERPVLESLIERLDLKDRVRLTGFRDNPLEFLGLFDCFVMSSYLEGLGTSVMDAQAMGIPVVATNTGGIPELVEDGVTGLLAPPKNPDALAAAIARMISDSSLRARCVGAAKIKSKGYDYRETVYKTMAAYNEWLEKTSKGRADAA